MTSPTTPTPAPRRRLRRVAAGAGAVALAAPFALGVTALGATTTSSVSAGQALTDEPGVVTTADRGFGPPRGRARGHERRGGLSAVPDPAGLPGQPGRPGRPGAGETTTDTVDATAEQSVGVVQISATISLGSGRGTGGGAGEAAGTGLILSADGLVVTNHHVVADGTTLDVTVAETGETYEATYVGGDVTRDIAVLRLLGATDLTPVLLDDDGVDVGEVVTSVGDAGGDGGSLTAAEGVVTDASTGIDVSNDDGTTSRLRALIEVDADIVPGDSGGALLDADGEVVGMNVAASSGRGDIIGYAIPVDRVLRVTDAVLEDADQAPIS